MNAVTKSFNPFLDQEIEPGAVLGIEKDRLAAIATNDDMLQRPSRMYSRLPLHAAILHNHIAKLQA